MSETMSRGRRRHLTPIMVPLLIWVALLLMPILINHVGGIHLTGRWYASIMVALFALIALFYADYCYFVKKYVARKKWRQFILINLVLSLLLLAGSEIIIVTCISNVDASETSSLSEIVYACGEFILLALTASLSVAVRMTEMTYSAGITIAEMDKLRAQSELQSLKSQINPHFLFNTLNNIYSLIAVDGEKAQNAIHSLSHLLRYIIYDCSSEKVLLKDELSFTKGYIDLESLRLDNSIMLSVDIPEVPENLEIAPLILIPFIENAFKHGVSYSEPSSIEIQIKIDGNRLGCHVRNTSHPKVEQVGESGVGVKNTVKRLNLLYGKDYSLTQGDMGDGFFETDLKILL